jgi:phage FluMu protein Com
LDYEIRCNDCEYLLAEVKGYEGERIHTQQITADCPQCGNTVAGYLMEALGEGKSEERRGIRIKRTVNYIYYHGHIYQHDN